MIEEIPTPHRQDRTRITLIVGAALLAAIALAIYLPTGRRAGSRAGAEHALPFGSAEQAYATKLQFGNFGISRAQNYLHQEVTRLSLDATNSGGRALREIEVTVEFHDAVGQIVLRETRRILNAAAPPLAPGRSRTFEISFEHLPDLWNRQAPAVRVTGLQFD